MPCLILDTSTELCLIALSKDHHILDQDIFPHHNLLSRLLLPSIQSLIEKNALTAAALNTLAVGIGPGSYTGTRLGASVGKSLAFGLDIPLKSFSSPLAFLPTQKGTFAFMMPTRSGSFFVLKGTSLNTAVHQESTAMVAPQELERHTENVDFFIALSQDFFSPRMKKKPLFHPEPNLPILSLFLSKKEWEAPENVKLLYPQTIG